MLDDTKKDDEIAVGLLEVKVQGPKYKWSLVRNKRI
jgi:hypothetical protein